MTPIIPHRKEKPLTSLVSLGGGAAGMANAGLSEKAYADDVFSTYLYKGTQSNQTINNGIDLSGEGGLTWIKTRANGRHALIDTERGAGRMLASNETSASTAEDLSSLSAFNSNGFSLGNESGGYQRVNMNNVDYASWTFRKQKGFFDVVTYTGNATNRSIPHNLGSIPGFIIVKRTNATEDWTCYNRELGGITSSGQYSNTQEFIDLNKNIYAQDDSGSVIWNNTAPTSTHFTVGTHARVNGNNDSYVAYLFAGGASTAATARSVEFDSNGDYLNTTTPSSDFTMGTGDFTVEYWFKQNNSTTAGNTFQISDTSGGFKSSSFESTISAWTSASGDETWKYNAGNNQISTGVKAYKGQWYHVALVRNSGTTTLYINGTNISSTADNTNYNGTYIALGGYYSTGYLLDGSLSNFRVVKGTAVYTSSFRPPTEPLTNISGTVLLCFNDSSPTGSTVTPVTLNSNGDPTASTGGPFDDPDGFKFGEEGDHNMIKCGSYIGNGSSIGPKIFLGWEPQWIFFKNASATENWFLYDSMRGIRHNGNDTQLGPNNDGQENTAHNRLDLASTGFEITTSDGSVNGNNNRIIYMAVRRPDGYVGKPAEAGTDVFSNVLGGASPAPQFRTGFPIDFAMEKVYQSASNWHAGSRLTGNEYMHPNLTSTVSNASWLFGAADYNNGFAHTYYGNTSIAWSWKRHAGFDVLAYTGDGIRGRQIPHSLNAVPEMMWIKSRTAQYGWCVYHKGLNGGTNPEQKYVLLEQSSAEQTAAVVRFNNTAPTSTHFTLGEDGEVNAVLSGTPQKYMAMLFSSVTGISKVGSYVGDGTTNGTNSITTGFQPRFVLLKTATTGGNWMIADTILGITAGNDGCILLNKDETNNQDGTNDWIDVSSTGFTVSANNATAYANNNGETYIYYAHA